MRHYSTILLGLLLVGRAQAQTPTPDTAARKPYAYRETMPVFPGGPTGESTSANNQRFFKFLTDSLRVPPAIWHDGVSGRVVVELAVDAQGRTTEVKLVQGLRADADAEALRNTHRLERIR